MTRAAMPTRRELIDRAFAPKDGRVDVLFIFPPATVAHRFGHESLGDSGGDLPPLGVCYIAAYLRERGYGVGVLDGAALGLSVDEIVDAVRSRKPRVLGISSTTYALPASTVLARRLRDEFPDTLLVLGGAHANAVPEHAIRTYDCFDVAAYGEGEETSLELLRALGAKGWDRAALLGDAAALGAVRGIVFRDGERVVRSPERPPIADLDALPLPARDLLPNEKYIPFPNQYLRLPIAHMVVIRGCPYVCSFCDQANTKARTMSPARAVEEMRHLRDRYGVREISFWDDTMSYNKTWIREFCDRLVQADLGVIWSCYATMRTMSPEILTMMRKAGCWNILYGIETGDPELMRNIQTDRKNVDADFIRRVVRETREAGIEVRGSFMFALPGETPAQAERNIEFAVELDCDYAQFSTTTPFPGTRLYDEIAAGKWGRMTTDDFSQFQDWNVVFLPEGYETQAQVSEIARKAFRRFYFRPSYILKKLIRLRTLEDARRYYKGVVMLLRGFAYGPMPDAVRTLDGRHLQETPPR